MPRISVPIRAVWLSLLICVGWHVAPAQGAEALHLLSVNFGSGTRTGVAAIGNGTNDIWNLATAGTNVTLTNLLWANSNNATGVTLTYSNLTGLGTNGISDTMMNSFLGSLSYDTNTSTAMPASLTVSNLPAGTYELYLYALGSYYGSSSNYDNETFRISVAGGSFSGWLTTVHPGVVDTNWTEGVQYVRFTNVVVGSNEVVYVQLGGGLSGIHVLNGLQIIDPASTNGLPALPNVVFDPVSGTGTPASVTLAVPGHGDATIYYTTNGVSPDTNSTVYVAPIEVEIATTIKAFATKSGYSPSSISTATYPLSVLPLVTFNPADGAGLPTNVVLSVSGHTNATIYYTTNGVTPTTNSAIYTGAIALNTNGWSYSANRVPAMTDYNLPSGSQVTQSSELAASTDYSWKAFDHATNASWSAEGTNSEWVAIEFPSSRQIARYAVTATAAGDAPKNWTFEGWNGLGYVVIDTRSSQTNWTNLQRREYICTNSNHFQKYRLNVSSGNVTGGNATGIIKVGEIEMFEASITVMAFATQTNWIDSAVSMAEYHARPEDLQNNHVPTATPQTLTVAEDTSLSITLDGTDADYDPLSYTIVSNPAHGVLTGTAPNVVYLQNTNYFGTDAFTFRVNDGRTNSSAATVSITVTKVNDAPTLSTITTLLGAKENTAFPITFTTLAASADEQDADGDTISFRIETVSSGTLTKGGTAVTPGTTLFSAGDTLVWTPPTSTSGTNLSAFQVKGYDGLLTSSSNVLVRVNVAAAIAPTNVPLALLTGTSLTLDGVDDYVFTPTLRTNFIDESITAEMWFQAQGPGVLLDLRGYTNVNGGWRSTMMEVVDVGGGIGEVRLRIWNLPEYPTTGMAIGTMAFATNWHHVALRYNKAALKLDGVLDGVVSTNFLKGDAIAVWEAAGTTGPYYGIGLADNTNLGDGGFFEGKVDEVRIWNRVRTIPEIQSDYRKQLKGNESGLVIYYRFDEGGGTNAVDVALAGKNGHVRNGAARAASDIGITGVTAVETNDLVIILAGYDPNGASLTSKVSALPLNGTLYQYSGGTRGSAIISLPATVTDSLKRVIYVPNAGTGLPFDTLGYVVSNGTNDSAGLTVTIDVIATNPPPTLTMVNTLQGGTEDQPYTITYQDLLDAADESTDTISFRIEQVVYGLLTKGGITVEATDTLISTGESLVWTPQHYLNGTNVAFTIRAFDGTNFSSSPISVSVAQAHVNHAPVANFRTNAVKFAASTAYMFTPNYISMFPDETVTLEVWFMANAPGVIVKEVGQDTLNTGWHSSMIEVVNDGILKVRVWDLPAVTLGTIHYGEWNHVALRYNKQLLQVDGFLNGTFATPISGDRIAPWETGKTEIRYGLGAADTTNLGNGASLDGQIAEFRVWSTARNNFQIQTAYEDEPLSGESGLVALFRLNEGIGNVIHNEVAPTVTAGISAAAAWTNNITAVEGNDVVVQLGAFDVDGDVLTLMVISLPTVGNLYRYDTNNSPSFRGVLLTNVPTVVSNSQWRLIYEPSGSSIYTNSFVYLANDGIVDSASNRVWITMMKSNLPPTVSLATNSWTVVEDNLVAVNGITLSDPDADSGTMQLTLLSTNGVFSLTNTTGLTWVTGANGVNTNQVINGSLTNLNAAIAGLAYRPNTNYFGTGSFRLILNDQTNTGAGGKLLATNDGTIVITSVNDAPTLTTLTNRSIAEASGTNFVVLSGIGAGAANESTQVLTVTAFSSVTNLIPNPLVTYTSASTTGRLSIAAITNQFGTSVISVIVTDNGGTTNGGVNSVTNTFSVTVVQTNKVPTLNALTNLTILEDSGLRTVNLSGIGVGRTNEAWQTLTVTATSSNPTLIPNPTVGYTNANSTGSISFTPATNQNGTATIKVVVSDDGGTLFGGRDSVTNSFTVTVTAVNDAPVFTLSTNSLTVLKNTGVVVITNFATNLSAGATDETAQALSFTITNITGSLFSVSPSLNTNGTLSFTTASNAFGTNTLTVYLSDNGGTTNGGVNISGFQTFVLAIQKLNVAPVISLVTTQWSGGLNTALNLTGISVADVDAGAENIQLSLTVSNGRLNLPLTNGLTFLSGTNGSSTNLILQGTLSMINSALSNLVYAPLSNYYGNDTVTVLADDLGHSGYGGNLSNLVSAHITISQFAPGLLGYWRFDSTNWIGEMGQMPLVSTNLSLVSSWSTNAVLVDSVAPPILGYNIVETNGCTNLAIGYGTVQFWFKPNWDSEALGGTGPVDYGMLFVTSEEGYEFGNLEWGLSISAPGNTLFFDSYNAATDEYESYFGADITFSSTNWYQITLTYTPTNSLLYINGELVIEGAGVSIMPQSTEFHLGNTVTADFPVHGVFDELKTYSVLLSAETIAADYAAAMALDSDLDGLPNVIEMGFGKNPYVSDNLLMHKISGDLQLGFTNATLIDPFVVRLSDCYGQWKTNMAVKFEVTSGSGEFSSTVNGFRTNTLFLQTDSQGYARAYFHLSSTSQATNVISVASVDVETVFVTFSCMGSSEVPTPVVFPPAGTYFTHLPVSINSAMEGVSIYYTTSGTDPSPVDQLFTNGTALVVRDGLPLKVRAYYGSYATGAVVTVNYQMKQSISMGETHLLQRLTNGLVMARGINMAGQLGDATHVDAVAPAIAVGLTNVSFIIAGNGYSYALDDFGRLWTWGGNESGFLENGSAVPKISDTISNIVTFTANSGRSAFVEADRSLWIGEGDFASSIPQKITNINNAASVTFGAAHTLILLSDGTVKSFGSNLYGQLGSGSYDDSEAPVRAGMLTNIIQIASAVYHSFALDTNGDVWTWGDNFNGQLGTGSFWGSAADPEKIGTFSNIVAIASGTVHGLALDRTGHVWAWGGNSVNQLGITNSVMAGTNQPTMLAGLSNIVEIAAQGNISFARQSDGVVWAWGQDEIGMIFGGTTGVSIATPVLLTDYDDYYGGNLPVLDVVSGNNQTGYTATFLDGLLVLRVKDGAGTLLTNAPIALEVISGDAWLHTMEDGLLKGFRTTSDSNGEIQFPVYGYFDGQSNFVIRALAGVRERIKTNVFTGTVRPDLGLVPMTTITSPTNGLFFTNSMVQIDALASDPDGVIVRVEFTIDGINYLGEVDQPPYSLVWTNATQGFHEIRAIAVDNVGNIGADRVYVYCDVDNQFNGSTGLLSVTSGNNQTISLRGSVFEPYVVKLCDTNGVPQTNSPLIFKANSGFGVATQKSNYSPGSHIITINTDTNGEARVYAFFESYTENTNAIAVYGFGGAYTNLTVNFLADLGIAPSISITNPALGTVYLTNGVAIQVDASDADGFVRTVDFIVDGERYSRSVEAPYASVLTNIAYGFHIVAAIATDNSQRTASSVRAYWFLDPLADDSHIPSISITNPTYGLVLTNSTGTNLSLTVGVSASDPDGTVERIEFYDGPLLIGSLTNWSSGFTWTNLQSGVNLLYAIAIDDDGYSAITTLLVTVLDDTDGDGVPDLDELLMGTDPDVADSDGDGVNDRLDAFPLDPTRSSLPGADPSDHTPPVITLDEPADITLLP